MSRIQEATELTSIPAKLQYPVAAEQYFAIICESTSLGLSVRPHTIPRSPLKYWMSGYVSYSKVFKLYNSGYNFV